MNTLCPFGFIPHLPTHAHTLLEAIFTDEFAGVSFGNDPIVVPRLLTTTRALCAKSFLHT